MKCREPLVRHVMLPRSFNRVAFRLPNKHQVNKKLSLLPSGVGFLAAPPKDYTQAQSKEYTATGEAQLPAWGLPLTHEYKRHLYRD